MSISAAVSIITIENSEVLILKRAINDLDPWSGHLSLPGGKIEPDDLGPLDAAVRETYEECGINLPKASAVALEPEAAGVQNNSFVKVMPYYFQLNNKPAINLQLEEHSHFYWVPLSYLSDKSNHKSGPLSISHPERNFPYVMIEETPLWGFTYKVLSDFFNW